MNDHGDNQQLRIATLASELVGRFGDDAIGIAERQIEATSGDTAMTWEAIVLHLSRPTAGPSR